MGAARGGVIATAHPAASAAGRAVLAEGGNAIDAAIAASAVLGVAQPMMSGLGGDTFVLYWNAAARRVHAIDGAGPAPRALSPAWLDARGLSTLPERGLLSASVPGAVSAMCLAHARFGSGRHALAALLAPAIRHAADGIALTPGVARFFAASAPLLAASPTARAIYCAGDRVLGAGETLRQPALAATLERIAADGADGFYRGPFADRLAAQSRASGAAFDVDDLAGYRAAVVEPIATRWRDRTVYSNPPVGQGVVLLETLGILETARADTDAETGGARVHRTIEALKRAFADRNRFAGDPRFVTDASARLLSPATLRARAASIDPDAAWTGSARERALAGPGDTTCLAAADRDGNAVAWITSLSAPFGAADVVDGTGVLMNNRTGRGFSLDPASPNVLAPGKRTMSTLHAYVVCDEAGARLVGGTSGGDGQAQWNVQVLDAVFRRGLSAQEAIDAPRWELTPGTDPVNLDEPYELRVDPRLDGALLAALRARGHAIGDKPLGLLGAAQAVMLHPDGTYDGGADPRADGSVMTLD